MKKSQLVSAIKTVLAENKKEKLNENTIREIIREVLSEEVAAQSALHKIAKECGSFQEFAQKALTHLKSISKSTYKTSDKVSPSLRRSLKNIWDERNDDDYDTVDEQNINEEAYDTVQDVTRALNNSRPSQDEVEDYLGRSLSSDELRAFGFNSGTVIGYKHGQPQYAGQGQRKTYTSYARGNSRRSY